VLRELRKRGVKYEKFKKERKYILSLDNHDLEADCWLGIHEEQMILIYNPTMSPSVLSH
jgi:hypothetical protein